MDENKKLEIAKDNILRKSSDNFEDNFKIQGYNFNDKLDYSKLIDSYFNTGFQATNLSKSIEIIKKMRAEKCTIFLGYTSNMVTSGLRDIFRYLAENKLIDVIVTTAGGVEEDLIKCIKPFLLGDFNASGKELRDKGINRTGNIFVPNDRYVEFEKFFVPLIDRIAKLKESYTPSELIEILGKEINNEESIYFWCTKNNIPVFCPAFTDGSMGDMVYFYLYKNNKFKIDIAADIKKLNDIAITSKKTGLIILGSGVVKHHILNANMFRNGANYSVYINNSQEFDGSDAGARPDEAVSWGKILPEANSVQVFGDATILFPLIVAKCFI